MRKLVLAFACIVGMLLFTSVGTGYAADLPIRLYLDNKKLNPEVAPRIINEKTMVPVRIISEEVGAEVSWNGPEQRVTVQRNGLTIQLVIDKAEATVNGVPEKLEVAPLLADGNTLLPVRFVCETLGLKVQWDELTHSVFLFDGSDAVPVGGNAGDESGSIPAGATPKPTSIAGGASTPKPASSVTPTPTPTPKTSTTPATDTTPTPKASVSPTPKASASSTPKASASPTPKTGATPKASSSPEPGASSGTGTGTPSIKPSATPKPGTGGNTGEEGGDTEILLINKISLDGDVLRVTANKDGIKPAISRLSNPERLIIDIPYAALGKTVNGKPPVQNGEIAVNSPHAGKIRYALFMDNPSTVRIVVDLNQKIAYTLLESTKKGEWAISLKSVKYTVVLDAGHGGKDPGAMTDMGHNEKDFNLSVVLKIAKQLEAVPGFNVQLTRSDDTFVELDDRVEFANGMGADLFVSIHGNKFTKESISGTETYYSRDDSLTLAEVLHRRILGATQFVDRGVRTSNFRVTKGTIMPAVLCEIGYLSNAQQEQAMFDEALQIRVAESIAAGIKEYLQIP
ncbi:MAG: hypothetical protein K0R57_4966 [Paenibacillaceae bacterium]|jgi:N-acetylmuramoyl-L-alanine amidase|nr:hypothetical protein [Paenibacillaceae bacterium]